MNGCGGARNNAVCIYLRRNINAIIICHMDTMRKCVQYLACLFQHVDAPVCVGVCLCVGVPVCIMYGCVCVSVCGCQWRYCIIAFGHFEAVKYFGFT